MSERFYLPRSEAFPRIPRPFSCCPHRLRHQLNHAYQVVRCGNHVGNSLVDSYSSYPSFPQATDALDPPKYLFNPFSFPLTYAVSLMPSRSSIQPFKRSVGLLGNVRLHVQASQALDKFGCMIPFVCTHRLHPAFSAPAFMLYQLKRHIPFRCPRRWRNGDINTQPISVFHQHVTGIRQLRSRSLVLPSQQRLWIGSNSDVSHCFASHGGNQPTDYSDHRQSCSPIPRLFA